MVEMATRKGEKVQGGTNVAVYIGTLVGNTGSCPQTHIFGQVRPKKSVRHQTNIGLGPGMGQAMELEGKGATEFSRNQGVGGISRHLTDDGHICIWQVDPAKHVLLPGVGVDKLLQLRVCVLDGGNCNQMSNTI